MSLISYTNFYNMFNKFDFLKKWGIYDYRTGTDI